MINIKKTSLYRHFFLFLYLAGGFFAIIISSTYGFNRETVGFIFFAGAITSQLIPIELSTLNQIDEKKGRLPSGYITIASTVWLYLLIATILIYIQITQYYYLTASYFVTICMAYSIILFQIFFQEKKNKVDKYLIIAEICITCCIIAGSFLFLFPESYGNDASYHIGFIKNLLNSGNIYGFEGYYQSYPLYHILSCNLVLISMLNLKVTLFVLALVQIVFLLFVFILSNKIFNSEIALLSTLLTSVSTNLIVPRYTYYVSSFSIIFFILILYFMIEGVIDKSKIMKILLIFSFVTIVFFHPIAPAIAILTLLILFIVTRILNFKNISPTVSLILITIVVTINHWAQPIDMSSNLFSFFITSLRNAFEGSESISESVMQTTLSSNYTFTDILLYDLGFVMLLFFAIVGGFFILNIYSNGNTNLVGKKRVLMSTVTLVFIPIPYLLAIIYPQSLPARWFPFIEVFASIFAGVAFVSIYKKMKDFKLKSLLIFILLGIIFFSITSPTANPNSHIYSINMSTRSALIESEINAANFVNAFVDKSIVHGNSKYLLNIDRKIANYDHFINPTFNQSYREGVIIVRNEDLRRGFVIPLYGSKNKLMDILIPDANFQIALNSKNYIYNNGEVHVYTAGD